MRDGLCSSALGRSTGGWAASCVLSISVKPRAGPLLALSCDRSLPWAACAYGELGEKRHTESEREGERGFEGERERRRTTSGARGWGVYVCMCVTA